MDSSKANSFTGFNDQFFIIENPATLPAGGSPGTLDNKEWQFGKKNSNGSTVDGLFPFGDQEDAFLPCTNCGDRNELSLSSNPSPVSVYTYRLEIQSQGSSTTNIPYFGTYPQSIPINFTEENRQIHLNGIQVKIVSEHPYFDAFYNTTLKMYKVEVRWDDYDVRNDVRWCGDIVLHPNDFNIANPSLNLKTGKTIRIDRGLSPTIHKTTAVAVLPPNDNLFTLPSVFTCETNSRFHLEDNATVLVENLSTLTLKNNSHLEVHSGAVVRIKSGSTLNLESGSFLYVHDGGKVIIESGCNFTYAKDAQITLNGPNAMLEINGKFTIGSDADFKFVTGSNPTGGFVRFGLPSNGGAPNIICGANSKISLIGADPAEKIMEVMDNTYVFPDFNLTQFTILFGKTLMGKNATVNTSHAAFTFKNDQFTALNPALLHGGLIANGQANHTIDNVEISYGKRGFTANQFDTDGSIFKMYNSNVHHCTEGLVVFNKGVYLNNTDFNLNTLVGYKQMGATLPSRTWACDFNENTVRGIWFQASGGNLTIENCNANENANTGVYFYGNGRLIVQCSNIMDNASTGIYVGPSSYLQMDNTLSNIYGSKSTVTGNPLSIQLNWARDIYLNKGRNDLVSLVPDVRLDVKGSLTKQCPANSSILNLKAAENHWNLRGSACAHSSPTTALDYNVWGTAGCNIHLIDPVPVCPPVSCVSNGGGGNGGGNQTPLIVCENCTSITTPLFQNVPLNVAIQTAISKMEATDPNQDDLVAITHFKEILQYTYTNLSEEEDWLLDLAYTKMLESFAGACSSGKISTVEANHLPVLGAKVQEVMNAASACGERFANSFTEKAWNFKFDLALIYHTVGRNESALSTINTVFNSLSADMQLLAAELKCLISAEKSVISKEEDIWEFENLVGGCPSYFKQDSPPSGEGNEGIQSRGACWVYPQPSTGQATFYIEADGTGHSLLEIFDTFGRKVGVVFDDRMELGYHYEFNFDGSALDSGIYFYRFESPTGKVSTGNLLLMR
jgi:Right handed beta helix region